MGQSYVYLLKSLKDGSFYTGWTTNLERRLHRHNRSLVRSTKAKMPYELIYYEVYPTQAMAKDRERKLKRSPNMMFYFKRRAINSSIEAFMDAKQVVG